MKLPVSGLIAAVLVGLLTCGCGSDPTGPEPKSGFSTDSPPVKPVGPPGGEIAIDSFVLNTVQPAPGQTPHRIRVHEGLSITGSFTFEHPVKALDRLNMMVRIVELKNNDEVVLQSANGVATGKDGQFSYRIDVRAPDYKAGRIRLRVYVLELPQVVDGENQPQFKLVAEAPVALVR